VESDADETCEDEGTALEEGELGAGVIRERLELAVPVVVRVVTVEILLVAVAPVGAVPVRVAVAPVVASGP